MRPNNFKHKHSISQGSEKQVIENISSVSKGDDHNFNKFIINSQFEDDPSNSNESEIVHSIENQLNENEERPEIPNLPINHILSQKKLEDEQNEKLPKNPNIRNVKSLKDLKPSIRLYKKCIIDKKNSKQLYNDSSNNRAMNTKDAISEMYFGDRLNSTKLNNLRKTDLNSTNFNINDESLLDKVEPKTNDEKEQEPNFIMSTTQFLTSSFMNKIKKKIEPLHSNRTLHFKYFNPFSVDRLNKKEKSVPPNISSLPNVNFESESVGDDLNLSLESKPKIPKSHLENTQNNFSQEIYSPDFKKSVAHYKILQSFNKIETIRTSIRNDLNLFNSHLQQFESNYQDLNTNLKKFTHIIEDAKQSSFNNQSILLDNIQKVSNSIQHLKYKKQKFSFRALWATLSIFFLVFATLIWIISSIISIFIGFLKSAWKSTVYSQSDSKSIKSPQIVGNDEKKNSPSSRKQYSIPSVELQEEQLFILNDMSNSVKEMWKKEKEM